MLRQLDSVEYVEKWPTQYHTDFEKNKTQKANRTQMSNMGV